MKFKLSGNLTKFTGYKKEILFENTQEMTLKEAFEQLTSAYPALHSVLYDGHTQIKKGYLISLNGTRIDPNKLDVIIDPHGSIDIYTAIAGG